MLIRGLAILVVIPHFQRLAGVDVDEPSRRRFFQSVLISARLAKSVHFLGFIISECRRGFGRRRGWRSGGARRQSHEGARSGRTSRCPRLPVLTYRANSRTMTTAPLGRWTRARFLRSNGTKPTAI